MAYDGRKNLIPMSERSKDEVKEIASRGGKKSGETRRKKKAIRDSVAVLMQMPLSGDEKTKNLKKIEGFTDINGQNISVAEAIAVKLAQKALKGDREAIKMIMQLNDELTNPRQKEVEEMRLELMRMQMAHIRGEDDDGFEIDDGFLKALNATADGDWNAET